jgi:hypothetical protein
MFECLMDGCLNSALPYPNSLLLKERGSERDGWCGHCSSSPLYKGGLRGVVQGVALSIAQNIKHLWNECLKNSASPHPNPLLLKERETERDGSISQAWEEWLQYCTEGAE